MTSTVAVAVCRGVGAGTRVAKIFGLGVLVGTDEGSLACVGNAVGSGVSVGVGATLVGDSVGSIDGGSSTGTQAHAATARTSAAARPHAATGQFLGKDKSSPVHRRAPAPYAGSARNTGIFRSVRVWYSSYGGYASTARAHNRSRSASSSTSRTRML